MWGKKKSQVLSFIFLFMSGMALANDHLIRWTGMEDGDSNIDSLIAKLNQRLGASLTRNDFLLEEDRDLAFNHYQRWVQLFDHVPIQAKSIRIWTDLTSKRLIQLEADLQSPTEMRQSIELLSTRKSASQLRNELTPEDTLKLIRNEIKSDSNDPFILGIHWKDEWKQGKLFRIVKIKGKRGIHTFHIHLKTKKVFSHTYREFPQNDIKQEDELTIPARVFPIYEEVEGKGTQLQRVPVELRHISTMIPKVDGDILAPLKNRSYFDFKYDPTLGETEAGRSENYWSMNYIIQQVSKIRESLPTTPNDWSHGVLLQGKFATINIHPDAVRQFKPLNFKPQGTSAFFPSWINTNVNGTSVEQMIPSTGLSGKPLYSLQEAPNRPARRLPDHNPLEYMNDGFDEIQVYYAINTLMEQLQERGFRDPEISTRPFNAFLFNPDISMRDNAYYTDDTINFTTYSPKASNYARDNSTIWHELGHGVMDRLMGSNIELADTGGLSEGMADFVAAIVVQAVTNGVPFPGSDQFRINNKTGFNLTNEVHDDGEAYGGAMKDFLDGVLQAHGQRGLNQVTDVVLEAMRFTRDFPGLTAPEWFSHILFADSLGRPGLREPNELKPFLLSALAGRNFKMDGGQVASFSLENLATHQEIAPGALGSRDRPIRVVLGKSETANFQLQAKLQNSDEFSFHYPVQVRVQYKGGPLQGAIHWIGEEQGDQVYTLRSESDAVAIPLQVSGTCDEVNRESGACVDYAYIQVWNDGEAHRPTAKKRFYLSVQNPS